MNINEIKLSVSQIQKMKHAIGLENPSRSKKHVHRNYYVTGDDPEWNEMVKMGLAVKRDDPFCKGDFVYHLTAQGMEYISNVIGKKIIISE